MTSENNLLKLSTCSGNTFHRLFQHSTQPQLDKLKSLITKFHNLNEVVNFTLASLGLVMLCLGWMSHVILAHILYLLSSILYFELIQKSYVRAVQVNLVGFMFKIRLMLLSSSAFIHALMNVLILHFCDLINRIFDIIKAKLLYYLYVVNSFIVVDTLQLSNDIESFKKLLSELQSEVVEYIQIFETIKELLKTFKTLLSKIPILETLVQVISPFNKIITKLYDKFTYENDKISKTIKLLYSINLEKSIELNHRKNGDLVMNLKINLGKLEKESSDIITMKIDHSTITKFQKSAKSIENIKKILDMGDIVLLKEIMSIIVKLDVLETINLPKLYISIKVIQMLYYIIIARGYLLLCTILFYTEIAPLIIGLCESMKFDSCNVSEFLTKCCQVENYITTVSNKIHECIIKIAQAYNTCKGCISRKQLIDLFKTIVTRIVLLKFYVDLIAREILIFKNIINNLIVMTVSSFILDGLIKVIEKIEGIDKAIVTLVAAKEYLRAFYIIQLHNTMTIFALSSSLKFSQSIHENYKVLLLNLDLINRLIWVIECYIQHLIVFKYTSESLNYLYPLMLSELKIITEIKNVVKAMSTISDKLQSIDKSIGKLKTVSEDVDITKWKQKAQSIRDQTQSINTNVTAINSELANIIRYLSSIYKSFAKLLGIYYYLLVLMDFVFIAIVYTNYKYRLGIGIENPYFFGLIMSIVGPCNKQLKFILGYLLVMSAYIRNLINIVKETIVLIYKKLILLYGLTAVLKEDVDKINEGVVKVECAIEGVARKFILCTIKQVSTNLINHHRLGVVGVDKSLLTNYSLMNVIDYNTVINTLFKMLNKTDGVYNMLNRVEYCNCLTRYNLENKDSFRMSNSLKFSHEYSHSKFHIKNFMLNEKNHFCLCIVTNYILYPRLVSAMCYLMDFDLDGLSTLSRKFHKYLNFTWVNSEIGRIFTLSISVIEKVARIMKEKLVCSCKELLCRCVTKDQSTIGSSKGSSTVTNDIHYSVNELNRWFKFLVDIAYNITSPIHQGIIPNIFRCYCTHHNNRWYSYFVSIILVLSSLVENLWTMDPETMIVSIQKLSLLYSQLEIYDLNSTRLKAVCCNPIYWLLVTKECQTKEANKCCCCWCVPAFNLLMVCISLSIQCKLCKALCNNSKNPNGCKKVKQFCEVKDCECMCAQAPAKGVCCLLKLSACSQASGSGSKPGECKSLKELLGECSKQCGGNGCCKTLLDKVEKGLCKVLLLGCQCNCTPSGSNGEVKTWCVFFNDLNEHTRVAVLVFCKCKDDKCCCLTKIIGELETKLKNLCNGDKCVCKELKTLCEEICGSECGAGCPCKTLESQWKKICGGDGDCLCKLIPKLKECCTGKTPCKYANEKGCCKCPCCKIVAHSIKILRRACKANVLEPYKRIVTDLFGSGKYRPEIIRKIVNGINQTTLNNIHILKNNVIIGSYEILNTKNSIESRNWGYDTRYEHQPTDNRITDQYTNITCNRTGGSVNKMFKLVLSRMVIAAVIVRIFIFIRISYQQTIVIDSSLDNGDSENKLSIFIFLHLKNIFTDINIRYITFI